MQQEEICQHCGAKMKEYWHRMTPLLAITLIKFSRAIKKKGINDIHVPKDVELTKTEYNNFQKLRFHGLIAKVKDANGNFKSGHWCLTYRGLKFIRGEENIAVKVKTFRNKVIGHDLQRVYLSGILNSKDYLQKDFDYDIAKGKVI